LLEGLHVLNIHKESFFATLCKLGGKKERSAAM